MLPQENERTAMTDIIQVENKFYISVNSSYADDRVKVLNHVDTFGIFDRWGDMKQLGEEVQGIYHNGTRFISDLEFRVNDQRPLLLSSSVKEENEILSIDLTNPTLYSGKDGLMIPKGMLHIGRSKFLRNGACYEQVRFQNFGSEPYQFEASFQVNADFKDIFEVRGIKRDKRGEVYEIKHQDDHDIVISYRGLDGTSRCTYIHFSRIPDSWEGFNKAIFNITLEPHEKLMLEYSFQFQVGSELPERLNYTLARQMLEETLVKDKSIVASIRTSNQQYNEWIERSQFDLLSLLSDTPYGRYPYAGVPWYNTAFGRDGIITALETLWAAPHIAKDALNFLAHTQATTENPYQDAEPGKIIHEKRSGEMVEMNEIPFKQYYGTVDATPLFVVLAGQYYMRTADLDTIRSIWPNIEAALKWIDDYADIDGDGFADYHHKSMNGLTNQGWKDSHDSISDDQGRLAAPPISLCEVHGYIYDAKKNAAILAKALGNPSLAEQLEEEAADLKKRFNEQYWDDELQCYVIALDGEKNPCRVVSSNAGHCLYSGIADEDKAARIAKRFLQPDMFSGWGIRTLSTKEKRYNPMSYHNGSVWPHDVAITAAGFARYGLIEETLKLTSGLFEASLFIELQRLPELFCGFDRRRGEGPTAYPVACSPQAWSVAAVYLLLQACMRMEINALDKKIYFTKPVLPEGIDTIEISNLRIGNSMATLQLYCDRGSVGVKVKDCPAGWQVLLVAE